VKKFEFLEDIATADVAFEAYGKDLNQLFENSALALFEAMVDTKQVRPISNFQFPISNPTLDGLLFDFLNELVFLKDEKGMVFSKFKLRIEKLQAASLRPELGPRVYKLQAQIWGEEINPQKHRLKADVKAVTLHQFRVRRTKEGYRARIVVDV